jgi:two-component system, cell cycle response regulator
MRVVVVDSSRTVLRAVSKLLESDRHTAATFVDAGEALNFIKSDREAGVLITSVELTSMSGLDLCRETRLLSGRDRTIYIILMSSNCEERHLVKALDSGADEFIRKPLIAEELHARLRSAERLLRLQGELIRLARVDPLTGVLNRRAFFEAAEYMVQTPFAAIMFDVDHFKEINDSYGHDVGDQVLHVIGHEVSSRGGVVGRLGGEEFAVLLEGANLETATAHAELLRVALAELSFDTGSHELSVTCSLGVAAGRPGETIDHLLRRADAALYAAKEGGRDRVVAAAADLKVRETQPTGLVRSRRRTAGERPTHVQLTPGAPGAMWWSNLEEAVAAWPDESRPRQSQDR